MQIGLVQTERNLFTPNIPQFRDNFVAALNEITLFEGTDLAVMFTHIVLVVMAASWSFTYCFKGTHATTTD